MKKANSSKLFLLLNSKFLFGQRKTVTWSMGNAELIFFMLRKFKVFRKKWINTLKFDSISINNIVRFLTPYTYNLCIMRPWFDFSIPTAPSKKLRSMSFCILKKTGDKILVFPNPYFHYYIYLCYLTLTTCYCSK